MRLFCSRFITIRLEVKKTSYVTIYVLRIYFYVYRYAYVLLRDQLSTLNRLFGCLSSWYDVLTCKK